MLKLNENDKILIVRLSALGDCIHTIPLATAIKKAYPDIFIGWAVGEKCKDVILNNPCIDKIHIIPKKNKQSYINEIQEIRKEKYTVAIDSQELLKSAVISILSGAKYRLCHNKSREFSYLFANKRLPFVPFLDYSRHVIERNLDFAKYLGIENPQVDFVLPNVTDTDKKHIDSLLENIDKNKKTVIIAPATTWITKYWVKKNWAKVIEHLNSKVNIIFSGSNADNEYVNDIINISEYKNVINLCGQTNITQLSELFSRADIILSPDSGSAHLATATKKAKIICLFGSTSSIRNGAFGNDNINLSSNLSCQPCYKKVCKYTDGIPECISALKPETVISETEKLL